MKFHILGYDFDTLVEKLKTENLFPIPWITQERKSKILEKLKKVDSENIKRIMNEQWIHIVTTHDIEYPEKLRTIKQAPYLLYVRWNLLEKKLMLGIVWSRKSTSYGKKILEHLIPSLVSVDSGIVSGWAYGIDALSHEITLLYHGYTISVFGCWVDISYPPQNQSLFDSIISHGGALVSIFPIGTQPEPYNFPIRNEIVAALSDGIIIPEAGLKSGTLITANLALEHGRDVFAIPGDIFRETSAGTNMLISTGQAKSITGPEVILEEYFPTVSQWTLTIISEKEFDTREQKDIYTAIQDGFDTPDTIGQNTNYTIETIIMTLSLLEIDSHIKLWLSGKYQVL